VQISEGVAATLRASPPSPDILGGVAIGAGVLAAAGVVAIAAMPAVRRMVMPLPVETYLSDLLQFERMLDDGQTIRTKGGGLVQTIMLRGLDVGGLTADELDSMLVRRKAWFERVAEAGLFAKVITARELVSYALDADYENPILQAIHDDWSRQFLRVYSNRDYIVLTAPKDDRNATRALQEADNSSFLSVFSPDGYQRRRSCHPRQSWWRSWRRRFSRRRGRTPEVVR
jgi:hypothetical protein